MNIKEKLREKVRNFLGISELERQLRKYSNPDLVKQLAIRAQSSSAEFIETNMTRAKALDSNFDVLDFALAKTTKDTKGLFCEFGVYSGSTINHIARKTKSKVYGFDSFEGLPEFWRDGFPEKTFDIKKGALPKCESNVELIVGWFDKTLPSFVLSHSESLVFLHIDCDLYSSTKTVFEAIGNRLVPGSIIVFDEYFNYPGWQEHEHRAFADFVKKTGYKFEYICYNRNHEQVAVQIL